MSGTAEKPGMCHKITEPWVVIWVLCIILYTLITGVLHFSVRPNFYKLSGNGGRRRQWFYFFLHAYEFLLYVFDLSDGSVGPFDDLGDVDYGNCDNSTAGYSFTGRRPIYYGRTTECFQKCLYLEKITTK